MTRGRSSYHRDLAAANRSAILDAATQLFLESGYDRTPLARVAERAGVSKATLFKQFPTKAELFEATVLEAGGMPAPSAVEIPDGDFQSGLVVLGRAYADLLVRPRMVALMRTVIAESHHFPELRERTFDFGTLPVLQALAGYLREARARDEADIEDPDLVSAQFLGMIASAIFWPRFMHGTWSITESEQLRVVDEAARTIAARFAAP
ncbi:MAG: TetR/AcrR family transcriptional regulator [Microbacterium sp.]|jgi:AcrR family transcriptional regulator|uniref:TetR/AcrR family transcriptional regulator n=1 Tax=Microbacterium sp. TaxID=51671 RepID=UPI00283311F7|nr:TetR/AcrR family transcriptional regulator [Microbacterium sp.]MDR2322300.1 TetR/AcrR family transcriptional regulator [Microbacterium sp.]